MASSSSSSLRLLSLFVLSQFLLISTLSVSSSAVRVSSSASEKVSLALYYESLCPYCSNFIVNYLANIFEKGLIDIIDLNLVPYGNARVRHGNVITCQHGPNECLLNTVEACAINVWPDLNKHFTFIYCIESLVLEHKYKEWETCFAELAFDKKPIFDCYNGGLGQKLNLQYANETNALIPPHRYVPWVTVNGVPLYDDYENFITYVCNAYKGIPLPKACRQLPLIIPKTKSNEMRQVTFVDETSTNSIIQPLLNPW